MQSRNTRFWVVVLGLWALASSAPALLPKIYIDDQWVDEGDVGTTDIVFNVTLTDTSADPITVQFATADVNATAGIDYVATNGTLTIAPGDVGTTLTVRVINDTLYEVYDEAFTVTLSNPSNALIGASVGHGHITENDQPPGISISDATVVEGNAGTTSAVFTVTLSNPSIQTVSVRYNTGDDTATAGSDYTAATGQLLFDPGMTSTTLTVQVKGDRLYEVTNEDFVVWLNSPSKGWTDRDTGFGTIIEDDAQPTISISDATVIEGNSGTTNAVFTVSLSNPSIEQVNVNYATADGTATDPDDYTADANALSFDPGVTNLTLAISVNGDTDMEGQSENFLVDLDSPDAATLARDEGTGTIVDDDTPLPRITTATKGVGGLAISWTGTDTVSYTVMRTRALQSPAWTNVAGASGLAGSNGIMSVVDPDGSGWTQRFYRVDASW